MGTWSNEHLHTQLQGLKILPSRTILYPLPTRFPGLHTTSIEAIRSGRSRCSWCKACSEAMLNLSEPQKRMRKGSNCLLVADPLRGCGHANKALQCRNGLRSCPWRRIRLDRHGKINRCRASEIYISSRLRLHGTVLVSTLL